MLGREEYLDNEEECTGKTADVGEELYLDNGKEATGKIAYFKDKVIPQ